MSVKLQTYSLELKAQAVRMAVEEGLGINETAQRLSTLSGSLAGWVAKIPKGGECSSARRTGCSGSRGETFGKRKLSVADGT